MQELATELRGYGWQIERCSVRRVNNLAYGPAVVIAGGAFTVAVMASPAYAAVMALPAALYLASKPLGRLLIYICGALFMFQGSGGNSLKLLYMAAVLLGGVLAMVSIGGQIRLRPELRRAVPQHWQIFALGVALALTLSGVRIADGQPLVIDFVRDATTYALLLVAPAYGIDCGLAISSRLLKWVAIAIGTFAAVSFMVSWLSRRDQAIGDTDQFALSSSMLAVPAICLCLTLFLLRRRGNTLLLIIALALMGMIVMGGGRSGAIYSAAALIVYTCFNHLPAARRAPKAALLAGVAVLALLVTTSVSAALTGDNFLSKRLDWFTTLSTDSIAIDPSGIQRLRAYSFYWNAFKDSPIVGNGLGVSYPRVSNGLPAAGNYTLDSPLLYLAKFGLAGTTLLLMAIVVLVRGLVRLAPRGTAERQFCSLLLLGACTIWVSVLPSGAPTEQKGFGLSVALLVALCVSHVRNGLIDQPVHIENPTKHYLGRGELQLSAVPTARDGRAVLAIP